MAVKQDEDVTRAKILETIDRLFYRQGIRAVGVDTIVAELGISKKTLYRYFRSKSEMVEAYLRGRFRPFPVDSDKPPAEQILSNFAWLERSLSSKKEYRGCAYLNALAELGDDERESRDLAASFKESRRLWFRDHAYQKGSVVDARSDRCRPGALEKCRREPQLHPAVKYRRSDGTPRPFAEVATSTYRVKAQRYARRRAGPLGSRRDRDEAEPADHGSEGQRRNQEVEAVAEQAPVNDRVYSAATMAERRSKYGIQLPRFGSMKIRFRHLFCQSGLRFSAKALGPSR
jgi:AcrR family transcriptional regulator